MVHLRPIHLPMLYNYFKFNTNNSTALKQSKALVVCFFLLLHISISAQEVVCYESRGVDYVRPFNINKRMFMTEGLIINTFTTDTVTVKGRLYYKEENSVDRFNFSHFRLIRKTKEGLMLYNESKNKEELLMPSRPTIGTVWTDPEQRFSYRVIDTNAVVETPFCTYTNLLKVEGERERDADSKLEIEYQYFMKGIGLVAIQNELGKLSEYLLPANDFYEFEPAKIPSTGDDFEQVLQELLSSIIDDKLDIPYGGFNNQNVKYYLKEYQRLRGTFEVYLDEKGRVAYFNYTPILKKESGKPRIHKEFEKILKGIEYVIPAKLNGKNIPCKIVISAN